VGGYPLFDFCFDFDPWRAIGSILDPFCIFCGHLEYFTVIWNILRLFPPFWYVETRKIWQPCGQPVFIFFINLTQIHVMTM
jgi:hypothetical protein